MKRDASPKEKLAYHRAWYQANKAKQQEYARKYYQENKAKEQARYRRYRAEHPDRYRVIDTKYYTGHKDQKLTAKRARRITEGDEMRKVERARHGAKRERNADRPRPLVCEVCGNPPNKKGLHFDHDHMTGQFRGWLCFRCNLALGNVHDDIEILDKLIVYLARSRRPRLALVGRKETP